jgi:hypothetical protein
MFLRFKRFEMYAYTTSRSIDEDAAENVKIGLDWMCFWHGSRTHDNRLYKTKVTHNWPAIYKLMIYFFKTEAHIGFEYNPHDKRAEVTKYE